MRIAQMHAKEMLRVKSLSSARRRRWQRWSEIQPTPFRQVYDFILHAVKGDKATADAIFEDYLAGKLSEELLSISGRWVSADQAGSTKGEIERNGAAQREHAAGAWSR
jgi:hypothetical protein